MASSDHGPVVVIGEALMDVVTTDSGSVEHPGGSPMNVSLGLGRLNVPVSFVTALGDDARGATIKDHLEQSGVQIVPGLTQGRRTSSAEVALDADGVPAYRFDVDWTLENFDVDLGAPSHVHFGSIGAYLTPGAGTVRDCVDRSAGGATVSFDPNIRSQFLPDHSAAVATTEGHVSVSDVVKASDEDLAWLYPQSPPEVIAQQWLALGPSMVIVTRGGAGATLVTAAGTTTSPGHAVDVVDTIGAGDAFMSGLIAGIHARKLVGPTGRARLQSLPLAVARELVDFAMLCGAKTVQRAGAQPPSLEDLPAGAL